MQSLPGFTRQKAYRKRASGRARFLFPGGYKMAVSMYSLVQPATKSSPVFLNALNNEPLKVESAYIDQDTGVSGPLLVTRVQRNFCAGQSQNADALPALLYTACGTAGILCMSHMKGLLLRSELDSFKTVVGCDR